MTPTTSMIADQPGTTVSTGSRVAAVGPILVTLAYLVGFVIFLPRYSHQINPDAINYIHMAQAYVRGDIANALNGCWSPLFAWLLVPFVANGADILWAAKIVTGIGGLAFTLAGGLLFRRFGLSPLAATAATAALAGLALTCAMLVIAPDILVSALLALYLALTLSPTVISRPRGALVCGLVAGIAFLTKAFALPFTLVHFTGVCALLVCRDGHRAPCAPAVRALAWFALGLALLTGPWIGMLSWRYGHFTVATSAGYNHRLVAPGYTEGHQLIGLRPVGGYPDDMSLAAKQPPSWSPFDGPQSALHQVRVIARGTRWFWRMLDDWQADGLFRIALIVGCLAAVLLGLRSGTGQRQVWAVGTIAVYVLGHSTVNADEDRYYWPLIPVFLALVFQWPDWFRAWANEALPGASARRRGLATGLAALLLTTACAFRANGGLSLQGDSQAWLQRAAVEMQHRGLTGPLASDDWFEGCFLSFFLDTPFLGVPEATNPAGIAREARGVATSCFVVFPTPPQVTSMSIPTPDLTGLPGVDKVLEYHDPILGGPNEMTVYRILPVASAAH